MVFGVMYDGVDVSNYFIFVEWFGYVVIGVIIQVVDFVVDVCIVGQDQDWCIDFGDVECFENVKVWYVGQVQVEKDNVVIVQFVEIDIFFIQIGGVDVEVFGFEY